MASVHLRQQVLDQLYKILKDPLAFENQVLIKIINASKDGLVSVKLVYGMTSPLKPYPVDYIEYCIPRDLEQRFRWSSDFTRVGLKENAQYYETNALGFIQEDLDDVDTSTPQQVQPVIYDHGKFYIDDEHNRSQRPSKGQFFEYDKVNIPPIGQSDSTVFYDALTCYNCGKSGHHFRDCLQPKDSQQISRYSKRLFAIVDRESMEPGKISQQLKEALGISENEEPPYYKSMRYFGYPPGYLSYCKKTEDQEAPLLKIYNGEYVIHTKDQLHDAHQRSTLTYSVEYPGLYATTATTAISNSTSDSAIIINNSTSTYTAEAIQQQWNDYYQYQHQYQYQYQYQYYQQQLYYTSEPQPPGVEYSVTNTQISRVENSVPQTIPNTQANANDSSDDMDISSEDEG